MPMPMLLIPDVFICGLCNVTVNVKQIIDIGLDIYLQQFS